MPDGEHPSSSRTPYLPEQLLAIRRSRRNPSPAQPDYLHLRFLLDGLRDAIGSVPTSVHDVLDVWCGSRPYNDLLPAGARNVGFDVEGNPYGVADVVSDTFLPFPDSSFDLVLFIESFQFAADPEWALAEFARVLRPGGSVIISMPFAYEYDPTSPEVRYTEHQLRALLGHWEGVVVRENGGRTVAWTTLTASLLFGLDQHVGSAGPRLARWLFPAAYAALNAAGVVLAAVEHRYGRGNARLPMDLMVVARKPLQEVGS